MGHQSGKIDNLEERDKFLKWLDDIEYNIFKIPRPDLQILLYADPKIAQRMVDKKGYREYVGGSKRDIHEVDINHLRRASEAFLYCAGKYGWSIVSCTLKEGMRTRKDIHEAVYKIVKARIEETFKSS